MSDYSSILFARPSFAEGVGRILDFGNFLTEYNRSDTGDEADRLALWADWAALGADLRLVILQERGRVEKIEARTASTPVRCGE